MPNALIPLPDVYESVTRRVAVDVISQLSRTLRLPGNTEVYLPGNTESVPMNGGTFGECWDPGVRYPAEARLIVRFNEAINEDNALTATVNKPQQMPLFWDEHRDVVIRPVYRYVNLTVSIEYIAPNITLAQRWLDHMRSQYSMGRAELYQDLEYHYAIPSPVLHLLKHIHETMEASPVPTGETFDEYFEKHRFAPVKTATTLSGSSPTQVVPEHQYEVLGWFDFTATPPTPEKDGNDSGTYTSAFTYTLHYNRPVQMYCKYPMLIHNNPVGKTYRPQEPYETFRKHPRRVSTRKGSFDEQMALMEAEGVPYIQYPDTDDWIPEFIPKDRLTFFTGLLVVSPDDPYTLMDLSNLGDFAFSPYFLEYFYTQGNNVFSPTGSIFEFRLYENNRYYSTATFTLTGTTISVNEALDSTRYYHLQISLRRNWMLVDWETLDCLRRYPTVAYWALRALGVELGGTNKPPTKNLLGASRPRPTSTDCPGEGSIIGPPSGTFPLPPNWDGYPGGTWPWPWLGEGWIGVPWPGSVPDGWLETPWPQLQPNPDGEFTQGYPGVTYPGTTPDGWPGIGVYPGGVIPGKDMEDARWETDNRANNHIDRVTVGPLTILYSQILTQHMTSQRK